MTKIIDRNQIERLLETIDVLPLIEDGFASYSLGQTVVPPVGELELDQGEVHIKYGYIQDQPFYVIKIASGFYKNSELGLATSNGCMLVFSQQTGQIEGILLDEGYLTDVRTAVAGAIVAKHLAPNKVKTIGIVGTGIQARLQLLYLQNVVDCTNICVWGRSDLSIKNFLSRLEDDKVAGFHRYKIAATDKLEDLQTKCQLIVSTTCSKLPLLKVEHLIPGTHITAVGADMPDKQELDDAILSQADLVVADSIEQCLDRGEISQALRTKAIQKSSVMELGDIIAGRQHGRTSDAQTTIADLTGVAVQDIQIASAILSANSLCT